MQELVLYLGDCVERMAELPAESVGAACCDPPYGISFMGKDWDDLGAVKNANRGDHTKWKRMPGESSNAPKFNLPTPAFDLNQSNSTAMQDWHVQWLSEAYRVLEPGGVIKVFSGTRTFHRLAAAMQKAGFPDIRLEAWTYGSGFPKSLNVSKALDKMHGAKRKMKQVPFTGNALLRSGGQNTRPWMEEALKKGYHELPDDSPVTDDAKLWEGWGTALKPAWEPVLVGRKPLETA